MSAPAAGTGAPVRGRRLNPRSHVRGPVWLLVVVIVLGIIFVLLDRTATAVAQDKVATKLTGERPFTARPKVTIKGFPFLTQAARGRYRHIVVNGPADPVPSLGAIALRADLYGVHVPASAVLNGVSSVPVDRVDVRMTVPVAKVASVLGVPGLSLRQSGSGITLSAPVDLPLIGKRTITATGRLSLTPTELSSDISTVSVSGTALPAAVSQQIKSLLTLRLPVTGLGLGVTAAKIGVQGSSIVLTGSAVNATLK